MPLPPEETPGLVATSDEAAVVHHVHHHHSSPPPLPSVITGHGDHKRKRTKHSVANDALPPHQELTAAWSTIDDADCRGATEHATSTSGAHRSQRRAPPVAEGMDAGGGSSSKNDDKALSPSSVAPAPASTSSKAIRVKHSSSSFVIGGGGGKQHPAAGSCSSPGGGGSHSYDANSHAAVAPNSSKRLTIRGPAAPPPPHIPAKARRPASTSEDPSAAVPLEVEPGDDECFRKGVEVFGEWDADTQQAAVDRFVRQQSPPKGDGFSFWLTPEEAEADLEYVQMKVEEAQRKNLSTKEAQRKAASGSGKPRRH